MSIPVLGIDAVAKRLRARDVLTSATLALQPGTITLLAGRNGEGKSTLMRICAGWMQADTGAVRFMGDDVAGRDPANLTAAGLFYLPDGGLMSATFTLRQHASAMARRWTAPDERVQETIARLSLADLLDRRPPSFSGGERRRAELALALIRQPTCLLVDEPLRGIDPRDTGTILAGLRHLADDGCAVLVTGHELPALVAAVDRALLLAGGVIRPLPELALRRSAPIGVPAAAGQAGSNPAKEAATSHDDRAGSTARKRPGPPGGAAGALVVDEITLRDLEIFQAQDGGPGVFGLLDRTRTSGGRARLRLRFRKPMADPAAIRETQDALRFIAARPELLDALPDEAVLQEVERYLSSSYETVSPAGEWLAWPRAAWYRLRYGDLYAAARDGVVASRRLLASLVTIAEVLRWADPPRPLALLAQDMLGVLDTHAARRVGPGDAGHHPRPDSVLPLDGILRGELKEGMRRLIACVHELDALRAMAQTAGTRGYAFPAIVTDGPPALTVVGLRHPFLPDAITNDLELDHRHRLLFLTGPNMAGKTTYVRAAALCVYLAHLGMPVPARRMELATFSALFSSMNPVDAVRQNTSYFMAEVRRVRAAAELMRNRHRVFAAFDEIFRGTNVRDAYDAARAVLAGFARQPESVVLVSSHLAELADDLDSVDGVMLRCFDAELRGGEPVFSYIARDGASAQRLGMLLLEQERVLELLEDTP